MAIKLKIGIKDLVAEAEAVVTTMSIEEAIKRHNDGDESIVFVDVRDGNDDICRVCHGRPRRALKASGRLRVAAARRRHGALRRHVNALHHDEVGADFFEV